MKQKETLKEKQKWNIGYEISKYRISLNMSQEDLAEYVGISRVSIVRIENGEQIPRSKTFSRICDVLGINANDLFKNQNEEFATIDPRMIALMEQVERLSEQKKAQFFMMAEIFLRGLEHPN